MDKPFEIGLIGLVAGLTSTAVLATLEPALAKKAPAAHKQLSILYSANDDLRCVERSFSISVGNPAYKNRLAVWPAPCRW
jgi:hypothetical protein